jgi:hypothetical protein
MNWKVNTFRIAGAISAFGKNVVRSKKSTALGVAVFATSRLISDILIPGVGSELLDLAAGGVAGICLAHGKEA